MEIDFKHLYERGFLKQEDFKKINEIFLKEILYDFYINKLRQKDLEFNSIPYGIYLKKLRNENIYFDEMSEEGYSFLEYNSRLNIDECKSLKREILNKKTEFDECIDIKEFDELVLVAYEIEEKIRLKYKETLLYKKFTGLPEVEIEFLSDIDNNLDLRIKVNLNLS